MVPSVSYTIHYTIFLVLLQVMSLVMIYENHHRMLGASEQVANTSSFMNLHFAYYTRYKTQNWTNNSCQMGTHGSSYFPITELPQRFSYVDKCNNSNNIYENYTSPEGWSLIGHVLDVYYDDCENNKLYSYADVKLAIPFNILNVCLAIVTLGLMITLGRLMVRTTKTPTPTQPNPNSKDCAPIDPIIVIILISGVVCGLMMIMYLVDCYYLIATYYGITEKFHNTFYGMQNYLWYIFALDTINIYVLGIHEMVLIDSYDQWKVYDNAQVSQTYETI
jgi:hypothetical protein